MKECSWLAFILMQSGNLDIRNRKENFKAVWGTPT
jgi:hypothetical protein